MNHINDMNDMKREVKKTINKAKYMAKEVAEDVKDNFEGAMNIMESKKMNWLICTNKRNLHTIYKKTNEK